MLTQIKAYAMLGLVAWAVAGPILTYGVTSFSAYFDKRAAVASARAEEKAAGEALRKADLQKIAADRDAKVRQALEELRNLPDTPTDDVELQKICDASVSCVDRRTKK